MSSNISNMKQAVFEMFGVGSGAEVVLAPLQAEPIVKELSPIADKEIAVVVETPAAVPTAGPMSRVAMSYIAAGTVFEGTMHCDGDVEVAGTFKGDMDAKGTVRMYASMEGNVSAGSLTLAGCTLTGNVAVADTLTIGENAEICGDISAKELLCSGKVEGELTISGNAALERTAQIRGNIVTGSFAVAKGAVICGGLEIRDRE